MVLSYFSFLEIQFLFQTIKQTASVDTFFLALQYKFLFDLDSISYYEGNWKRFNFLSLI